LKKDILNEINYNNLIDIFTLKKAQKVIFKSKYDNFNYFIHFKKFSIFLIYFSHNYSYTGTKNG